MAKKRMMLSLDSDVYDLLKELSAEMSVPAATLIARLITDSKPKFKATLNALKLAKGGSLMALDNLDALADSVISDADKVKKGNFDLRKKP
jgi:hypothetical protein